jgi:hypothetical protein
VALRPTVDRLEKVACRAEDDGDVALRNELVDLVRELEAVAEGGF